MNLRLGNRRRALEKIEVAAFVGLADMLGIHRSEAALIARRRRVCRRRSSPEHGDGACVRRRIMFAAVFDGSHPTDFSNSEKPRHCGVGQPALASSFQESAKTAIITISAGALGMSGERVGRRLPRTYSATPARGIPELAPDLVPFSRPRLPIDARRRPVESARSSPKIWRPLPQPFGRPSISDPCAIEPTFLESK
jgi:hypothetical protein